MKSRIVLSQWNNQGACTYIENDEESFQVSLSKTTRNAKSICKSTAKRLRALADKFDVLAESQEPFNSTTQDQVNRLGVAKASATSSESTKESESK